MPGLMVVKRTGDVVAFDSSRIKNAIQKAVKATKTNLAENRIDAIVNNICREIETRFIDFYPNVENIQDIVEKYLVKEELYEISKAYILYRAERAKARQKEREIAIEKAKLGKLTVRKRDGSIVILDIKKVRETISRASKGYERDIDTDLILKEVINNIYDGIDTVGIERAIIFSTVSFIERDPAYSYVAANLFLQKLRKEVTGVSIGENNLEMLYRQSFVNGIKKGVEQGTLNKRMLNFDLEKLSKALLLERDNLIQYTGIQTLYERYFIKSDKEKVLELLQSFWMRVSMGLALNERNKEERAIEFYELISSFKYVPSTPTLFHAGTTHPQMSSCYLTTVEDDLNHIFKCYGDNAQLSKWSGGLGNDWTNLRSTGALIKSSKVESQGVIPFLKIANEVTNAINRSGKRRGATCAYLEAWHLDVEDFLDLRKNTGDERRRTHDMNTANWIPDLFMKRVMNNEKWTLFSPDEVPDLHHIYGNRFEEKYIEYENKARNGEIKMFKIIDAQKLWKKMLSMLFETGHPWMTFKDPCNIRSPQDHAGVIHSSNLCTEITLNTSKEETAVCNLGSINLLEHIKDGWLDEEQIARTVTSAVRMLDNVIDLNFYPTIEAENSNKKHRPIGLGIMGFQDALFKLNLSFDSNGALEFSDKSMEIIAYYVILASSKLAKEKGRYESYSGSKWDRNLFPQDTIRLLEEERGIETGLDIRENLDWSKVREHVRQYGMRNSNTMAIAPTATISTIVGCFPCIEPIYKNIYVKSNITGEFTIVNFYLVEDLKKFGLWNQEMLDQIKYYDGNLSLIASIPEEIKQKYKETFEIAPEVGIDLTAVRSKWIDQSQSHNIFIKGASGKKLSDVYLYAWKRGLKTTYYLRTLAASQIEKSTLDTKYGFTQKREYNNLAGNGENKNIAIKPIKVAPQKIEIEENEPKLCLIEDPDCEACQ